MSPARLGHVGIHLPDSDAVFDFWKDLLRYLGFRIVDEGRHFDASDGESYLCVNATQGRFAPAGYHRGRTGLNHIAFRVGSREEVDRFVAEFLEPRRLSPLYGGARAYPEYASGYYAVYCEDPSRIKIEVVFEPPLASATDQGP